MLKKVLAVFPVFIFFAYSGLFVFASPSSPVVFSSGDSASTNLAAEKIDKIDQLWSGIKDEIKNPKYYFLIKIPIVIPIRGSEIYDLGPLYKAAQTELATSGSSLTTEGAREKLLELVNAGLDSATVNSALSNEEGFGFSSALKEIWTLDFTQELVKPKYVHLAKTPISIKKEGEEPYKVSLEPLFLAARNQGDKKPWYELPTSAKDLLISLTDDWVEVLHLRSALAKTTLDLLWSEIKSELKTKYAHLSKTNIEIDGKDYKLEPLFTAAKNDTQYRKEGSELSAQAKKKLQELVNAVVIPQKFRDALANTALDLLWSEIKSELKTKYAHLSKTPILVNGNNYNLEPLFVAVKNEYRVLGSQLSDSAKNKLQSLFSAGVQHQIFKTSLATANIQNNQKLSNFWEELKKTKYANLARLPVKININNKSYDLAKIFSTITQFNGKGSKLPLEPRKELQNLINAGITPQQLGDVLKQMLVSLDNFWTQLKKVFNQPEFSKWKDTSIEIKSKNYNLQLLFVAAKEKADVKGSALLLNTKLQLQELLNDQVTSKMVENQLLVLNQAEAAKNKQAKEKQQSQDLTIGLATGGGVLFLAGVGGFLYWFFKIRK